jgi:hypothetical protein
MPASFTNTDVHEAQKLQQRLRDCSLKIVPFIKMKVGLYCKHHGNI